MDTNHEPPSRRTWKELWCLLPAELLIEIWRFALNKPQVHRIRGRSHPDLPTSRLILLPDRETLHKSTHTSRSFAATCTEARDAILACLPDNIVLERGIVLRFDGARDMICVRWMVWRLMVPHLLPLMENITAAAKVRHIGIQMLNLPGCKFDPIRWSEWTGGKLVMEFLLDHRDTKTLSIVTTSDDGDYLNTVLFAEKWGVEECYPVPSENPFPGYSSLVDILDERDDNEPSAVEHDKKDDGGDNEETVDGAEDENTAEDGVVSDDNEGSEEKDRWAGRFSMVPGYILRAPPGLSEYCKRDKQDVVWWHVESSQLRQASSVAAGWEHLLVLTQAWDSPAEERLRPMKQAAKSAGDPKAFALTPSSTPREQFANAAWIPWASVSVDREWIRISITASSLGLGAWETGRRASS